ncbi:MAG: glycogen debranching protein GlgX [Deltaproteobacteria bacterium]|nr:glycogen debranching protein GlgX [Deltaproteobacteria bacterium]
MASALAHATRRKVSDGRHHPLGATLVRGGVNFALYSRNARDVWLLFFDGEGDEPIDVIHVRNRTRFVWHVFVHGVKAGQCYGYKVAGDFDPGRGLRFNESKLLVDPYAKALTGKVVNRDNLLLAYDAASPLRDASLDDRDNASVVPKSIVVDDRFDWRGDAPLNLPLERLFLYEVHVKGFTAHPFSGVSHPGTYLGFVEKIPHLVALGVNAVELLPVHEFVVEDFLRERGRTNYWGYNTLGYFAPESSYGTGSWPGCQVAEFKTLVRELHRAGVEVILDVVFNHTAEGSELGPTLCFRGIDNPTYYCLTGPADAPRRYYQNYTGCGNSLDLAHAPVIRLVMDSLRYWVEVMHVDGFRFDLASVLGREEGPFRTTASFFDALSQDPVLQRAKLIAEPWDLGTYQVGNFPVDWSEWNGRFRDTVRRFVKGDGGQLSDLGWRLTGSADLYGDDGRSAYNSVNFVTCHDGFTLNDLVSHNAKHNEANGEGNRDGTDDNKSWNCGAEGDTDDPAVLQLRRQLAKNFACALFFSCGTPMVLGGDEFLRTQRGNNNAYCQDNELSWFDWGEVERNAEVLAFFRRAIAFVRRYSVLQQRKFLLGQDLDADSVRDITWFGCDGGPPAWDDPEARTLCYLLDGSEAPSPLGEYFLFFVWNADDRLRWVRLPALPGSPRWSRVVDTSLPAGDDFLDPGREVLLDPPDHYIVNPRSVVVLLGR